MSQTQPSPIDALPGAEYFLAAPGNPEARKCATEDSRERINALLQVDPDDRLALLESPSVELHNRSPETGQRSL